MSKYVCLACRYKIGADDLEEIFASRLVGVAVGSLDESKNQTFSYYWQYLKSKEKLKCTNLINAFNLLEAKWAFSFL